MKERRRDTPSLTRGAALIKVRELVGPEGHVGPGGTPRRCGEAAFQVGRFTEQVGFHTLASGDSWENAIHHLRVVLAGSTSQQSDA